MGASKPLTAPRHVPDFQAISKAFEGNKEESLRGFAE